MEREALVLGLGELAVRFSKGWHEGIKIDALDIVLLNEAAEALAQPAQEPVAGTKTWFEDGKVVTQYLTAKDIYKEPAQEPVAWMHPVNKACVTTDPTAYARGIPLYTTPPQRPWVGLTDEEIQPRLNGLPTQSIAVYARNIEAILKEKNT